MKKIVSDKACKLLLLLIVKVLVISVLAVIFYSFLFSEIIYRLDLSLDNAGIASMMIAALAGITISFLSCFKMKNNGLLMGLLSVVPLLFYTLINVIFHEANVTYFFIKLVIILLTGALGGLLAVKQSNRFKV